MIRLKKFVDHWTRVDSDDVSVRRRGERFNRAVLALTAIVAFSGVLVLIEDPGSIDVVLALHIPMYPVHLLALYLSRRGHVDVATGMVATLMALSLAVTMVRHPPYFMSISAMLVFSILLASISMRPKGIFVVWLIDQLLMLTAFALTRDHGDAALTTSHAIFVSVLLGAVTTTLSVHTASIERALDERRRAELARVKALNASVTKSQFLANMSHELRTPLHTILGYTELILECLEDDEDGADETLVLDLKRVHTAGDHMLKLVSHVLDLSKIEAGQMSASPDECSLSELIDELQGLGAVLAKRYGNRFVHTIDLDCDTAYTDRLKLRQIVLNLLSNACKFTHEGTVTLRAFGDASTMVIEIEDTGEGIEPEELELIFEAFEQGAQRASHIGGTGLGLALCREFARLLGGDISVESEPERGSCFRLVLPLRMADAPAGARDEAAQAA